MGSRGVFQPVGQKRLTNIAVVRLRKAGHRFEIACYRNKVADWRNGIEKDVDEVLQTTTVFAHVSKGILAKDKELQEAFGTTDQRRICLEILAKGEVQIAEEERKVVLDNMFKDVACVLVEKCVNPESGRPYTLALLERALKDVHFNVDPKKPAKQQALEAIPVLQQKFPIERARMRLKLTVPLDNREDLDQVLGGCDAHQESVDIQGNSYIVVTQVDPGMFRELHTFMVQTTKNRGRVEVVSFAVVAEGSTPNEFAAGGSTATGTSSSVARVSAPGQAVGGHEAHLERAAAQQEAVVSSSVVASTSGAVGQGRMTRRGAGVGDGGAGAGEVVYPRGSIVGLPDEHASRRERFAELDQLQAGWEVELRKKGDTVEAVFFPPGAQESVGAFALARRQALAANKAGVA